ncbi:MAG: hypothetical protein DHS20C17_07570 [Cyclobacteriaceae bacterium]|nr:MAG: hypothetical protein DHS20C17_07570 [Cyclobacteriaceae bacterium]
MTGSSSCYVQGKDPVNPNPKEVSIRDLYGAAREEKKILLVDAWADSAYSKKLRELVDEYHSDRWQLIIKAHHQVTADEIASLPVMLVGQPGGNSWIAEFLDELPFSIKNNSLNIGADNFDTTNHALVLSYYPNPLNTKMPIGIFTSGSEPLLWELVNARITSFLRGNWGYEVLYESHRVLLGNLSQKPETRWEIDPEQQIRLPGKVLYEWESGPFVFKSYHQQLDPQTMGFLTRECERELTAIIDFTGNTRPWDKINYSIYPNTEIKGLMTGNTDHSHKSLTEPAVYTAFDDHFHDRYYGKENEVILRQLLGNSAHEVLELGLGLYFTSQWEKQGYQYWAKHIMQSGLSVTVTDMLDADKFSGMSRLHREALAGSLTDFLIDYWGKEKFLNNYVNWNPGKLETEELTRHWIQSIDSDGRNMPPESKSDLVYLKGFNFTHEGYQVFNGYGSLLSEGSLDQVRQLGSNAVAIVPYSWMADPTKPAPFRFSTRAGGENDEGVIHALCEANKRGLFTLLKPHVWIGNSWPGEVEMQSQEDWDLFFEHYYNYISHYALMAEIYQVDALSIGVEFSKATLSQETRWRQLITRLRKIYHGNLTYSANWGEEFESIGFWDELDFIGLNCYYPLSDQEQASGTLLKRGFEQVLRKIDGVKSTFQKPVVFTEIGFRSVASPWLRPHEEAGDKEFNEDDQAKAYEAVFQAIASSSTIDGILWWKWPTNPGFQGVQDRRFVPTGKKAEKIIAKWFESIGDKKTTP